MHFPKYFYLSYCNILKLCRFVTKMVLTLWLLLSDHCVIKVYSSFKKDVILKPSLNITIFDGKYRNYLKYYLLILFRSSSISDFVKISLFFLFSLIDKSLMSQK
jgi:hypothetical protein